jgi:hypothetical protein
MLTCHDRERERERESGPEKLCYAGRAGELPCTAGCKDERDQDVCTVWEARVLHKSGTSLVDGPQHFVRLCSFARGSAAQVVKVSCLAAINPTCIAGELRLPFTYQAVSRVAQAIAPVACRV